MKKVLNVIIIILVILIVIAVTFLIIMYPKLKIIEKIIQNNSASAMKAVVVDVNEKSLDVMGFRGEHDIYSVSYANEGNIGFKQGQEVLIYFDGSIAASYPAQIHHVQKIEIVKEKSNTQIPISVLKHYFSSRNNVTVSINQLTPTGISLSITDTNELKYDYYNDYMINKKNKVQEYLTPLWQEAKKISDVSIESTVKASVTDSNTFIKECDWTSVYGELKER